VNPAPDPRLAARLERAGRLLGVACLVPPVWRGAARGQTAADLMVAGVFAGVALVALGVTAWLSDRLLFGRRLGREVRRGNPAAALAAGAHFVASALIAGRCFSGDDLALLPVSLAFFALAQVALQALVGLFRALTCYDDDEEIAGENLAAAISYGGVAVAVALIVSHAADGPFLGWPSALRGFALSLMLALGLYPVRQLVVGRLVLGCPLVWRGGALDRAVREQRDVASALAEAAGYLAAALLATGIA
jgi:uncharacterized membrane protein YjfL (UPF0719 family)